jgi:hypothetical protein
MGLSNYAIETSFTISGKKPEVRKQVVVQGITRGGDTLHDNESARHGAQH